MNDNKTKPGRRRNVVAVVLHRITGISTGQTFVLMSLGLVAILGIVALAVDVGNLWFTRRLMQSAADAGAVAAADEIATGMSGDVVTAAAKDAASRSGFTNSSTRARGSTTVTV